MNNPSLPQHSFEKHKKRIFLIILYGLFTQCMNLSILGPLFPIKAKEFDISDTMIGLIFSGFPLGAIICTIFIRQKMPGQRKNYLMAGVIFYVIGMTGFGLIFYAESQMVIIIGSIACRFIMGIGMSMYDTPALSFVPLLYGQNIHTKLGIIEGAQNLGFMLGPLIGIVLYDFGSYQFPFFVLAALQFITLPLLLFLIPNSKEIANYLLATSAQRQTLLIEEQENRDDEQGIVQNYRNQESFSDENIKQRLYNISTNIMISESKDDISYRKAFCQFKIFLIMIMIILTADGFLFLDSQYATFLDDSFNLSQNTVNYIFVASYSCSAIFSPLVCIIAERRNTNLNMMILGFCILFLSYLFIGPAEFLPIQNNLIITIISRCIIACCQQMVYIPAIKELYFILQSIFQINLNHSLVSDMASTIYIVAMQSGELLGPIIGGIVTQNFGFKQSSSYLAIFSLSTILLLNIFKRIFKHDEEVQQEEELNKSLNIQKLQKNNSIEQNITQNLLNHKIIVQEESKMCAANISSRE